MSAKTQRSRPSEGLFLLLQAAAVNGKTGSDVSLATSTGSFRSSNSTQSNMPTTKDGCKKVGDLPLVPKSPLSVVSAGSSLPPKKRLKTRDEQIREKRPAPAHPTLESLPSHLAKTNMTGQQTPQRIVWVQGPKATTAAAGHMLIRKRNFDQALHSEQGFGYLSHAAVQNHLRRNGATPIAVVSRVSSSSSLTPANTAYSPLNLGTFGMTNSSWKTVSDDGSLDGTNSFVSAASSGVASSTSGSTSTTKGRSAALAKKALSTLRDNFEKAQREHRKTPDCTLSNKVSVSKPTSKNQELVTSQARPVTIQGAGAMKDALAQLKANSELAISQAGLILPTVPAQPMKMVTHQPVPGLHFHPQTIPSQHVHLNDPNARSSSNISSNKLAVARETLYQAYIQACKK